MKTSHFEVKSSPFNIGAGGPPIQLYQGTMGRPETGIWTQEDEDAYIEFQTDQAWQVLRITLRGKLPKNWEFTSEVQ